MRDSGSFDRAELGEVDLGPRQEAQRGAVGRTAGDGGRSGQRLLDEGAHVVGRDAVLGPEPLTLLRFTPSSRANLRTEGEACGSWPGFRLASSSAAAGAGRAAGAAAGAAGAGASALGAGAAAAAWAGAAAAGAEPSTTTTTEPLATLSPTLTFTS